MQIDVLNEPELEFGGGGRHVDPRFGIAAYGPADLGLDGAPTTMRLGLVGPRDHLDGLRRWIDRCRQPIDAKDARYPHLFPAFPGCDAQVGLFTTLTFAGRNCREVSPRALEKAASLPGELAVKAMVDAYMDELEAIAEDNRVDVIVVARPDTLDDVHLASAPKADDHDTSRRRGRGNAPVIANFHDLLKARALRLGKPLQILRRSTWDESAPPPPRRSRQDEATRAWNLHVALYYKAGGVPWRLRRTSTDLATCYVGISFYRTSSSEALDTAVAHIFNERGDGVIVRGGTAHVSRDDKQPHLLASDAKNLLLNALAVYKREHRTLPARVAIHKSSRFNPNEVDGFTAAADDRELHALDLIWITNSEDTLLFRPGAAPPLRGTFMTLSATEHLVYTKGSVDFYSTYPGMYVPRPVGLRPARLTISPHELATEILALSKMNWNQSQLDGRFPITLRTADQVKQILRFCNPTEEIATRYAQYM
ncbi:argonaute/piwi family protein [Micromonospora sp. CPCC 205558]|uniref:argonaute/piwi family protein n=1 Tax=Micromonospora sp. CPCC 205558 TaxID=3122403 RepID=UPI002FF1400D